MFDWSFRSRLLLQIQRAYASEANSIAYTGIVDGLTQVVKYVTANAIAKVFLLANKRVLIRTEGVLALYKGALARVAFHAPSTAITMSLFESCRHAIAAILDQELD